MFLFLRHSEGSFKCNLFSEENCHCFTCSAMVFRLPESFICSHGRVHLLCILIETKLSCLV